MTPLGPVWLLPDGLGEKAAMQAARLELAWPDLEGFTAMHTGPPKGGAFLVRAPKAALERAGLPTASAAEYPVKEGTVWPPLMQCVCNRTPNQERISKCCASPEWLRAAAALDPDGGL